MQTGYVWLSYLSGNTLIAALMTIMNGWQIYSEAWQNWNQVSNIEHFILLIPFILPLLYLIITVISAIIFIHKILKDFKRMELQTDGAKVEIDHLQIKNIFTTGSMTYYILPFISFAAGDDLGKNLVIVTILTIVLGILYVNENMAFYTPALGLCGFLIYSCIVHTGGNKQYSQYILVLKKNMVILPSGKVSATVKSITGSCSLAIIDDPVVTIK